MVPAPGKMLEQAAVKRYSTGREETPLRAGSEWPIRAWPSYCPPPPLASACWLQVPSSPCLCFSRLLSRSSHGCHTRSALWGSAAARERSLMEGISAWNREPTLIRLPGRGVGGEAQGLRSPCGIGNLGTPERQGLRLGRGKSSSRLAAHPIACPPNSPLRQMQAKLAPSFLYLQLPPRSRVGVMECRVPFPHPTSLLPQVELPLLLPAPHHMHMESQGQGYTYGSMLTGVASPITERTGGVTSVLSVEQRAVWQLLSAPPPLTPSLVESPACRQDSATQASLQPAGTPQAVGVPGFSHLHKWDLLCRPEGLL